MWALRGPHLPTAPGSLPHARASQPRAATHLGGLVVTAVEHGALGGTNLVHVHLLAAANFLVLGGLKAHERRGPQSGAEPPELKLGRCLEHQDAHAVEEVEGDLADRLAADDHVDAGVLDALDRGLHLGLFGLGVVHELVGGLDEHGTLGLSRRRVDGAAVDGDARTVDAEHVAERLTQHDHALDHVGGAADTAEDLGHAHVVRVEARWVRGHDAHSRLGYHRRDEVLQAVLLGGDGCADALRNLRHVAHVVAGVHRQAVKGLEEGPRRFGVARDNVRRRQAHAQQLFRTDKELPSDDDDEVGAIAHLLLLHLGRKDHEPRSRVLHLELLEDGR